MSAFIPAAGLSAIRGTRLNQASPATSVRHEPPRPARTHMTAYPYTGSGYGTCGVPYGGDPCGQSFKATTTKDIVQTAASLPIFSTLVSLLQETGLDYELAKGGPFTVFAPTDDAFASLLDPHGFARLAPLLRPENREELKKVLGYHVMKGEVSGGAILASGKISRETLAGVDLIAMGANKKVTAGSAAVIKSDIPCSNGVIHIISSILVPLTFKKQPAGPVQKSFPDSQVLDVYAKLITPGQALGIDPLPASADSSALMR